MADSEAVFSGKFNAAAVNDVDHGTGKSAERVILRSVSDPGAPGTTGEVNLTVSNRDAYGAIKQDQEYIVTVTPASAVQDQAAIQAAAQAAASDPSASDPSPNAAGTPAPLPGDVIGAADNPEAPANQGGDQGNIGFTPDPGQPDATNGDQS